MGLFDYVRCCAPLPGTPPAFVLNPGHRFQTKSIQDDPFLDNFVITEDGRLLDADGLVQPIHKDITFYDSNLHAFAGGISYTSEGEDAVWIQYQARFTHGHLEWIRELEHDSHPARPIAEFNTDRKEPLHGPSRS